MQLSNNVDVLSEEDLMNIDDNLDGVHDSNLVFMPHGEPEKYKNNFR